MIGPGTRHARLALALGVLTCASPALADPPVRAWCYPSGLRIAAEQRTGTPVVGLATVVSGGSSAERPDEVGAAHLYEHLWFRSPRVGADSFDALVDDVGGEANAFTAHDQTTYLSVAPRAAIRALLSAEAERLEAPWIDLDEGAFEAEREIVRNELAQRYEGRQPVQQVLLRRLVPEDHPYARGVGGTEAEVASLGMASVQAYAERTYTPRNTSLYVVGDFEPEALLRMVHGTLPAELLAAPGAPGDTRPGPCEPREATWPAGLVDRPETEAWLTVPAAVDAPISGIGWSLPAGAAMRRVAENTAEVLEYHLQQTGHPDASCGVYALERLSLLACLAPDPRSKGERAWRGAIRGTRHMWAPTADHFSDAVRTAYSVVKARRRQGALLERSRLERLSPGGRLADAAARFHRENTAWSIENPVGINEVCKLGYEWLRPDLVRGVLLEPAPTASGLGSLFHSTRGNAPAPEDPGEVTVERLESLVFDPGLDRIDARQLGARRVWVLPWEGAARNRATAVFPAHEAWADEALRGRSLRLLASPWEVVAPERYLDAARKGYALWGEEQDLAYALTAAGHHAREVVLLLDDGLPPPLRLVPKAQVQTNEEHLLGWRQAARQNARWVAHHHRWRQLAEGLPHPWLDPEARAPMESVRRPQARQFLTDLLDRDRAQVVAVTTPEAVELTHRAVEEHFGPSDFDARAEVRTRKTRQAASRSLTLIEPDAPGPQARIALECHVDGGDAVGWWILEEALGNDLDQALRNDLGITYGVYPELARQAHGPTLHIATRVPHERAAEAIETILGTLDRAANGQLDPIALDRYRLQLARRTALRWQAPDTLLAMLEWSIAQGEDPGTLDVAERLHDLQPEDLAERLAPCTGHEAITVIGEEGTIGTGLEARGLDWSLLPSKP